MILEGKHAVREALAAGASIDKILIAKGDADKELGYLVAIAKKSNIRVLFAEKILLDRESIDKKHQGIIAYTADFKYSSVEELLALAEQKNEPPFIVILDGITDTHNLGSVIRVAECVGAHGIVIPQHRAASVNETVIRISAGAAEHIKIAQVTNINDTINYLKEHNVWVYAADMDGVSIYKTDLKGSIGIVIGGEDKGVKRLTRELCDGIIALPLLGNVNSLNASVAAGAVLYEAVRQRISK